MSPRIPGKTGARGAGRRRGYVGCGEYVFKLQTVHRRPRSVPGQQGAGLGAGLGRRRGPGTVMGTPRPGPRRALEDRRTAAGEVAWAPVPGCGGVRWRDDRGHGFGRRGRLPRIPSAGPVGLGSLRFPAPKSPAKSFRELRALEGAGRSGAGVAGVAGAVPILGESQ